MKNLFSILVILSAAGFFAAMLALNVGNYAYYADSPGNAAYHFGLPAGLAAATLAGLWMPAAGRLVLALCFASVVPALYGAELFITLEQNHRIKAATEAAGQKFDARTKIQVITDLRAQGVEAYPTLRARALLVTIESGAKVSPITANGAEFLPLTSVPGTMLVACNESGRWLIFKSDRYGFHNPPGAWDVRPINLALVGDSFVEGDCVPSDKNIAAYLRARYDGVLNLGTGGFGPLSKLASLREYLQPLRPRTVLWFFFEGNDITKDLPEERRSRLLMSYLEDPGFAQRLIERRHETAVHLRSYLDSNLAEAMARVDDPWEDVLDFFKLFRLRETFGLDPIGLGIIDGATEEDFGVYEAVIAEAKRTVESWGGRMLFVYLPDSTRYFASPRDSRIRDHIRQRVLAIVAELGLAVIDVHQAFAAHADPRSLYVYPGAHLNEDGYGVAARAVDAGLRRFTQSPAAQKVGAVGGKR